jgi:hypothetical protein
LGRSQEGGDRWKWDPRYYVGRKGKRSLPVPDLGLILKMTLGTDYSLTATSSAIGQGGFVEVLDVYQVKNKVCLPQISHARPDVVSFHY